MKKICFFNSNKAWGGGEKWNHHFSLLLRDAGYEVFVATNKASELYQKLENEPGITLSEFSVSNLSFLNPLSFITLRNYFHKNKIDCVIMALPSDLKTAGIAAKAAGVSKIIYRRGIAVPVRNSKLNRYLFSRIIDRLIVNSIETKKMVLKNAPNLISNDKIRLIYNGFDVADFDSQQSQPVIEKKDNEIIIGNAARLTIQKGQKYLLEAAAILRDKGLNFRIAIAGTGELQDQLMGLVRKFDLDDRVEFLGFVDDMKSFYQSIDIFCLPSLWEGFGYALVEAMTMEKPVAAFDISSNPEVVANNSTGLLVESGNVEKLSEALERLILNSELRNKMGKEGRKRVLENFDTPLVLGKLKDLIEE
ncbi:glycosyltransferase [Maridesulfovibrio bastinii]|uniref:glycosyltransferase n=1 Tax=Maridesulfovibrio bastinii TaxID=47157 RepID=UPI0003FC42C5|nr:glycosyltransferase [Maridesulfovibrio bastinii]